AVNHGGAVAGEERAELAGGSGDARTAAGARAAEDTDGVHQRILTPANARSTRTTAAASIQPSRRGGVATSGAPGAASTTASTSAPSSARAGAASQARQFGQRTGSGRNPKGRRSTRT